MKMFTRLFGRVGGDHRELDFLQAQRMVLDYARFLEHSAPMPGRIADQSRLPHPKARLKSALLLCIGNSSDERLSEHLRAGYLMLSAFQPDVGEQALGTDFTSLDLEGDMLDVALQLEQDDAAASPLRPKVRRELEELKQELYALELELAQSERLTA
ncbi:hypothetical protein E2F43_08125 [Seongchinamella unica]|uniref:Uncharacterized protein n=1 Tax=Seongchinamella unica TaxID=2547392 RepID=A0A4R5LRR5_9GAMM|nr:hypothetical protein [Seongchinamella unica]TDG13496.1 hypothetical protein E2F43_08125 [Seongchinamella unica]